ncbi:MAG TPA: hypothetical protein VN603_08020 [Candidatus Acidoferrales bacterium]|nr:hypothetical protein [Candidatus Acidoferrales bacterium]
MLKPHENDRITRVGPGTPMGNLMRSYWQPAALAEELPEDGGPPLRVRLLGEDLLAFRDAEGDVLLATEPAWNAPQKAYFTWEGGGIVWAYMGPASRLPAPPNYEVVRVPATHRAATKNHQSCNWLQVIEGAVDSVHFGFLHNTDITAKAMYSPVPTIEFEKTDHGLIGAAIHQLGDGKTYARTFHFVMPAHSIRGRTRAWNGEMEKVPHVSGQIAVPIDDEHTWLYSYIYSQTSGVPMSDEFVRARWAAAGRGPGDVMPGYRLKASMENDYFIDRRLQKTKSFSGIPGVNTQDVAIQEGMGAILDRSKEHLAVTDRVIIAARQLLLEAIDAVERGETPRGLDPASYAGIRGGDLIVSSDADWREALRGELVAKF